MSNTATLPSTTPEKKLPKIDLRSVIIVAILAFGAGAYTANQPPANATPASQVAPAAAAAPASSGK